MASSEPVQGATERLSAMLEAVLKRSSKPEFDAASLRAQILSNAQTFIHMNLILDNDEFPDNQEPPMAIVTTNEDGQTRASVVLRYTDKDHKVMDAHFQGALADSDSEALLSLYEDSKKWTGMAKAELMKKGWWRD